jgi:hypothetical protein
MILTGRGGGNKNLDVALSILNSSTREKDIAIGVIGMQRSEGPSPRRLSVLHEGSVGFLREYTIEISPLYIDASAFEVTPR